MCNACLLGTEHFPAHMDSSPQKVKRSSRDTTVHLWRKCWQSELTLHWCNSSVVLSGCNFVPNSAVFWPWVSFFHFLSLSWLRIEIFCIVGLISHMISVSSIVSNINGTHSFGDLRVAHIFYLLKFSACVCTLKIVLWLVEFRCGSHSFQTLGCLPAIFIWMPLFLYHCMHGLNIFVRVRMRLVFFSLLCFILLARWLLCWGLWNLYFRSLLVVSSLSP